ncbi:Hypp7467 [Branchiostoma lanceolatum]|uniref:Hypp7467 protein n=1 Tax=Branchiostoma lanceolatum TaxID=7740 RepID=A0A8K0EBT2_BRALA|nr:Hypp7467 [Branchiostoma lanceolatum]
MDTIEEEVLEEDPSPCWEGITRRISADNLLCPPKPRFERSGSLEEERFLVFPDQECEELHQKARENIADETSGTHARCVIVSLVLVSFGGFPDEQVPTSTGKRASHPASPGPTATKTRVIAASPRLEKILTENGEENKTRRQNLTKEPSANGPGRHRHADVTASQPFSKKLLLLTEEHKSRSEKKSRLQKLVFGRKGKQDILAKKPNGTEGKKIGPGSEKVDEPPPSSGLHSGTDLDVNKIDKISNGKGEVPVVPSFASDCTKEDGVCVLPSKQKVSVYTIDKGEEEICERVRQDIELTTPSKNRDQHVSESTVFSEPPTIVIDSNQDPKPSGKARKVLGYVSPLPVPKLSFSRADQSERSVDVALDDSTWSVSLDDSTFNTSSVFSKSFREKFSTPASVRKFARSHLANIFTPRSHSKASDRKKPSIVHLHIPSDVDIGGNDNTRSYDTSFVIAEALENVVPKDITNAPPKSKKGLKFDGKANREMENSDQGKQSAGAVPQKESTLKGSKEEVPVTPANRVVRSRHRLTQLQLGKLASELLGAWSLMLNGRASG